MDFTNVDEIYITPELFPNIVTLVEDEHDKNNRFILILNSSLAQVSFKGITFNIEDEKTISCIPNYFMMLEDTRFEKQQRADRTYFSY